MNHREDKTSGGQFNVGLGLASKNTMQGYSFIGDGKSFAEPRYDDEKRRSQTAKQMDLLENTIHRLDEQVESLQERLYPALRVEPIPPKPERATAPMQAPIAEAISMLKDQAETISLRIEDMLNRLEL